MIGVLIVTHGEIGTALLHSASQILGAEQLQVATLSVWRQDDPDDLILRARGEWSRAASPYLGE